MGHRRIPSLRNEIVLRFRLPATYCFVVIAMMLLSPANSYASPYYDLNGYVAAYALPTSPWSERPTDSYNDLTSISDSMAAVGASVAGNQAHAAYYADLATGSIGQQAYAIEGWDPVAQAWRTAYAEATVEMKDTLLFTIPAGDYPDGIALQINGSFNGNMEITGLGQTFDTLYANIDGGGAYYKYYEVTYGTPDHSRSISDNFALTAQLASAGASFSQDTVVEKHIVLGLGSNGVAAATMGGAASANIDFYTTGKIQSINVPDGIGWTSASGVFLSEVPEPSSLLLFSIGLGGLLAWRRKNK